MNQAPGAGWYVDPSNPAQERWWGGVEWASDVRPLAAAAPTVAQPALVNVPGGGVNPFAEMDAQAATERAAQVVNAPQPMVMGTDFSSFNQMGTGATDTSTPLSPNLNASWFDPDRRPLASMPPSNGMATAGLVLSLVGVSLLGIIFSIVGLLRARRFENEGDMPVGRKRAAWGLGVGIAGPLVLGVLTAIAIPIYLGQQNLQADRVAEAAEREGVLPSEIVVDALGYPVVYDGDEVEAELKAELAKSNDVVVTDITCPREAPMVVGGGFTCEFVVLGSFHTVGITWTDNKGGFATVVDHAVQN